MKANRKFVEENEAVSAVIGVILMVAITVAIAATVYVYVSGMIGGTKKMAPTVQFTKDESLDRIVVATADSGIPWTSLSIKTDGTGVRARINTEAVAGAGIINGKDLSTNVLTPIVEDTGAPNIGFLPAATPDTNIVGSDFIDLEANPAITTVVTVWIVHTDTQSILQTVQFNSIQTLT